MNQKTGRKVPRMLPAVDNAYTRPAVWPPVVERALALGVNFFDTSISYNQGRSEAILGDVISQHAQPVVIATKVGFDIDFERVQDRPMRDYIQAIKAGHRAAITEEEHLEIIRRKTAYLFGDGVRHRHDRVRMSTYDTGDDVLRSM